jgi:hypothetical protein
MGSRISNCVVASVSIDVNQSVHPLHQLPQHEFVDQRQHTSVSPCGLHGTFCLKLLADLL